MKNFIVIGLLIFFVYSGMNGIKLMNEQSNGEWLHGKWTYVGAEPDHMTFYKDGTVEMSNPKRIYARCIYASVVSNEVSVECKVKNKTHELEFVASNSSRTLTNKKHPDSVYNKKDS